MARVILIPGVGHVSENDTRDYMLPGAGHFSATVSAAGVVEGTGSSVGAATVAAIASRFVLAAMAATGVGTPSGVGGSVYSEAFTSVGTGSAVANGGRVFGGVGVSAGVATVIGEPSVATADGTGSAAGVASVTGNSTSLVLAVASSVGVATVSGEPGATLRQGDGSAFGAATAVANSQIVAIAMRGVSAGVADADAFSGVLAGSSFSASGGSDANGVAPTSLVPLNFKPIEQRRVRMPKLPRPVDQWTSVATREFDSFFNDMHHYLNAGTFVSGVHTEVLNDNFTLTPETSVIFLMSSAAVTSDPITAIKSINNIPRIFIVVNTGLFPITLKDGANTIFGGSDVVLPSGRILMLVYTGEAWVGNAI